MPRVDPISLSRVAVVAGATEELDARGALAIQCVSGAVAGARLYWREPLEESWPGEFSIELRADGQRAVWPASATRSFVVFPAVLPGDEKGGYMVLAFVHLADAGQLTPRTLFPFREERVIESGNDFVIPSGISATELFVFRDTFTAGDVASPQVVRYSEVIVWALARTDDGTNANNNNGFKLRVRGAESGNFDAKYWSGRGSGGSGTSGTLGTAVDGYWFSFSFPRPPYDWKLYFMNFDLGGGYLLDFNVSERT